MKKKNKVIVSCLLTLGLAVPTSTILLSQSNIINTQQTVVVHQSETSTTEVTVNEKNTNTPNNNIKPIEFQPLPQKKAILFISIFIFVIIVAVLSVWFTALGIKHKEENDPENYEM